MGGVIHAIESGFLQREIAEASYAQQKELDLSEQVVVGLNAYPSASEIGIPLLKVDMEGERHQVKRLNDVRHRRDDNEVSAALRTLERAARESQNLMPPIIEAVRAYATLGEMMGVFRDRFGEYTPTWGL